MANKALHKALSSAERQAIYRGRMKADGYSQRSIWIRGELPQTRLRALLGEVAGLTTAEIEARLSAILADIA